VLAPEVGRLVDIDLFMPIDGGLRLRASMCRACATLTFPAQQSCSNCAGTDLAETALADRGTLWGFTVQRFVPKTPFLGAGRAESAPYAVGYVELADVEERSTILVESRIVTDDFAELSVGLPLDMRLEPLLADGETVWTFAFEPASRSEGSA
jgi:uncharacterized OB-fold protein